MRAAVAALLVALAAPVGAAEPSPLPPPLPLPMEVEVRFALTDHTGRAVTEADFAGRTVAIFFGYASCEAICSVALPRVGAALDLLGETGDGVDALMITIDPERDTVESLGPALARWHPRLIGLTGPEAALAAARSAFQVEAEVVAIDAAGDPIFAHGGFVYVIGPDGRLLALLPPILSPERMAEIIRAHL